MADMDLGKADQGRNLLLKVLEITVCNEHFHSHVHA